MAASISCRIAEFAPSSRSSSAVFRCFRTLRTLLRVTERASSAPVERVSRKRVARLMREAERQGVSRRTKVITTQRDGDGRPAPDLVDRKFEATGPDQLWVADITYIPTQAGSSTWRWCLMSGAAASSGGRWPITAHGTGACRVGDGAVAAPAGSGDSPLGSRVPVHIDRLRAALRRSWRSAVHGSRGRLFRQCDVRELLRDPRVRTARWPSVPHARRSEERRVRVHRGLV